MASHVHTQNGKWCRIAPTDRGGERRMVGTLYRLVDRYAHNALTAPMFALWQCQTQAWNKKEGDANHLFMTRAHRFPRKNLTKNSAQYLVNFTAQRDNTDEIPRHDEIMNRQVKYMLW